MKHPTKGPNALKVGLIAGCDYRACNSCGKRVFVPAASPWKTCRPCKLEETTR